VGLWSYIEQNCGCWTLPGGMGQLVDVLADRLATRGVTVLTGTPATDLVVDAATNRVVAVRCTMAGDSAEDSSAAQANPRCANSTSKVPAPGPISSNRPGAVSAVSARMRCRRIR
jgi:UDP-galactopyranose mutase